MSARSTSSITSDLVHCETKEDLSRLISLLHSNLESECESCITKSKIDSTVVILLETDTILCSLTAKFDVTIVQFTWKRLISFIKLYHALISSELIVHVAEALTSRAYQFIDALCTAQALTKARNHSSDDQCLDYTSLILCVQPLIFFSQRISAFLAYFPSRLSDTSCQRSIEVIFFLRGFLSTLELHPSHQSQNTLSFDISDSISRSEEYFWKALHPPLTASINDLDGIDRMSSTMNRQKRSRDDEDVNKNLISERSSYGRLMPLEKFHLCVRSISSTCCSVTKEKVLDLKQGEGFLGCLISIGVCLLTSYELEKLSEQMKSSPSTTLSDTAERVGQLKLPHTHTESYLLPDPSISILKIFLFSADKALVLYNSVCPDKYFTDALKRFKEAVLNYLESSYTSVHNVPGRAAAISDALLGSLITSSCEGGTSNSTSSRVSRNILCGIVTCMSSASQIKVGDILWGMYFKISCSTVECENNVNEEESHHEYGNKFDSRRDKAFNRALIRGSCVGHLRAVALTIRHYLSKMKPSTVYSFLTKIKELLDFNSQGKHPIKSSNTDSNILRNSSGNIELLLHSIPFTILLNRCKSEKATNDLESRTVSGQEGHHQRMTHDLLTVLLGSSLTLLDARESESKIVDTRLTDSCFLGHGAVLGVTMLSNLFLNDDGNFITSNNSDIKSTMQAIINYTNPKISLTALKKKLLKSIEAISKYFMGLLTNSRNGHCSIRTAAQYKKLNCCFNALLRLTKALGSILEIASKHVVGDNSTQQKMQNGQRERERVNHTFVELTEKDINILTACASATLSVSNILSTAWTTDQDALCLSSISKSVQSVCKIILINVNFFPKEIFEASRSLFPSLISNALALSNCYQITIKPIQETDSISVMYLKTGITIASMWSLLLSCLINFAKKLPPSLQSSVPSLVPQKALILVQAASRGSSGSISKIIDERNTSTTSGPLVTLSCGQKRAVCNVLWSKYCTNLKQFDNVDAHKNKLKHQKTAYEHSVVQSGASHVHADQKNLSVTFLRNGAGVGGSVSCKDRTEMLGIPSFLLDSSFHASFSASTPLSLDSNVIPVMQVLLVEDDDQTEIALEGEVCVETVQSVHNSTSASASILPIRGTCSYALLILPFPLPAADCTTLMNKIILKSTDSFAVLHLT